ncbi:ribulose-phosphate 3-epimerase [Mycoplasma flocculare]|uniref:Ribulose-phosphate 3-epimerase n=2 Tax=Mesomycoplasma flocculare TaxID=2128 RepID=A0A0A8ECN2_MESFC|nr:ribulose-phosphate 3-epimerase [Mesomycoplasma flocculare]MXR39428.1 ribulose-phosphate 3-epimerase [Mycoplasma sp. MF12]AJC49956.1 ribulose-phosphate 3-epimerase [Mesomycoplasma flocculare ATCC 27399]ENX50926.1 ribulose-phosphate 3-epimerase [Mesomycoplasma flocculare ATCC 27716]MXR05837.1 ribulose-phosphate 3-epimerase [Mesomycoplasma flocculare]MXR12249.1 ribulose-phosphate 3-epimerase [Mesomycoplasma flocculare]
MKKKIISPSLLNVKKSNRLKLTRVFLNLGIKWFHFDFMDGKFVENTAISISEIKNIVKKTKNFVSDVHLMSSCPEKQIKELIGYVDYVTIHFESINYNEIKSIIAKYSQKIKIGIAIKPETTIEKIYNLLPDISLVLVMAVEPGKGGQTFIEKTYEKINNLSWIIKEKNYSIIIQVDGGIKDFNSNKVFASGADVIVVGTFLAKKPTKLKIQRLLK